MAGYSGIWIHGYDQTVKSLPFLAAFVLLFDISIHKIGIDAYAKLQIVNMNYVNRPSNDGRVFPYTEERGGRR
jgi:hypothetical protein